MPRFQLQAAAPNGTRGKTTDAGATVAGGLQIGCQTDRSALTPRLAVR